MIAKDQERKIMKKEDRKQRRKIRLKRKKMRKVEEKWCDMNSSY
jgi:hypothetical protein